MPFVNPAWLAGAAAGAAPIVIHLLNKQRYRRVMWAAMEFLRQAVEKRRRRLRIEQLILLAVRTLILLLLAFALARPILGGSPLEALGQSSTLRVFVVDNSFSTGCDVGGETALERAKRSALQIVDRMRGQDVSCLILASDAPLAVIESPLADKERVKAAIFSIERSDRGGDIPAALAAALRIVARNRMPSNRVYLFTDLQQVGWRLDEKERRRALAKAVKALERNTEVVIVDVGNPQPRNLAVTALKLNSPVAATLIPCGITAEIANFSDAPVEETPLELVVDGRSVASDVLPGIKPAGTARTTFNYTFQQPGAHLVQVRTRADALPVDDQRHLAANIRQAVRVLIVDGDPGTSPLEAESLYLRLALRPEPETYLERRSVFEPRVVNEVEFEEEPLAEYDLVILANVPQLSAERIQALRGYVLRGGALMIFTGDLVTPREYTKMLNAGDPPLLPVKFTGTVGSPLEKTRYARWRITAPLHPAVRHLAELKLSLAMARFYRYLTAEVDEGDTRVAVLARFDDEAATPALVEYRLGRGRVAYVGTTADDAWHNLHEERFLFFILLNDLAYDLVQGSTSGRNLEVGQPYLRNLSPKELQGTVLLSTPDGDVEELDHQGPPGAEHLRFTGTDRAGLYTIQFRGTGATDAFAVNLDPIESNLARIDQKRLQELLPAGENVSYTFRRVEANSAGGETPSRLEIWRTLMLLLTGLVCLEAFLAWKFGKYR